jgi:hypothetical protein
VNTLSDIAVASVPLPPSVTVFEVKTVSPVLNQRVKHIEPLWKTLVKVFQNLAAKVVTPSCGRDDTVSVTNAARMVLR